MTPAHRCDWRHEKDKYGVVHRAWSIPKVRSRMSGEPLWHAWCRRLNTQEVIVVPVAVTLTCFWCLSMSFREKDP